ncbi:sensor histidine kinase [Streptomyces sp. AK02-01A]|uniref:sensor histidine kinase n=1 Tax=Streptomyces sp. AK02-01A TaxID=3028648 RepID=UPI0029B95092|nr:histidine kinase [Streptomyces sp. AK02-01A]MDX3850200.1 histidine kinase [Streptomyces sp. AK02-01A]
MSQAPEYKQLSRLAGRLRHMPAGVSRWLRREAVESWSAVRAAERRTVVAETLLCALVAAFGLLPLLLAPPHRLLSAVVEALWAAILVPARRGRPAAAVLGCSVLLVGDNVWTLAVAPLVVLSATRRVAPPRRVWRLAGVACAAVGVLTLARAFFRPEALPSELAENAVSVVLLLLLPALAGTLLGRRRPLVSLLRERNAYLEQARALTAAAARLEERTRIAGEMHDLLGHRLSLISVHAGALELGAARQAPAIVGQAEMLRTTAGTAMEELREILGVLRHEDLTGPTDRTGDEKGTREDITALVTESRLTGSTVELDWSVPDTAETGPRTRQAVHRVVREGLTNVLKHASGARTKVVVRSTDRGVEVSVTNEAPRASGHSRGGSHSGLAGCQERISLLGGTFQAGTLTDGGFRMAAWLPAHGNEPLGFAALQEASDALSPDPARPRSDGIGQRGVRAPLPDEILTWPRVLGSGCVALLVTLPTVVFLVVLLAHAALR